MPAYILCGHQYLTFNGTSYGWTTRRSEAYRFQDATAARSFRDWQGFSFVSIVDERGYAHAG